MDLGVIGGPDGPTVLFFTGDPVGFVLILLLIAAAMGAAVWFFLRKRKK